MILLVACATSGTRPDPERARERRRPSPRAKPVTAIAEALRASARARAAASRQALGESSLSVGTPSDGALPNGVELPVEGPFHSVIDALRKYQTRWGTAELVGLVLRAAEHVHRTEGGAPLRVGELSKEGGGDLRWHRSHNAGRDVDFAFYMLDARGRSVPAPKQLRFRGDGACVGRCDERFDVGRNWRLVEALLGQDEVAIQWIFVSRALKALLLDHARRIGADPAIVNRAELVLHQPQGASSHANHFHVRVACTAEDRLAGCEDEGPRWQWVQWSPGG